MSTAIGRGWRGDGWRAAAMLTVAAAGLLALGCITVQGDDGRFVMGGSIVVDEGEVARNDLVAIGGSIRVDGRATRDVVVVGGSLVINGEVGRDVVCVGGNLSLGPDARVGRDATVVGGGLQRAPGSVIEGEVVNVGLGWGFEPSFGPWWPVWWSGWWGFAPFHVGALIMKLVWWLVLALLTVALVGDRVSAAAHAVARDPIKLGALGFLGLVALVFAMVVLIILSFLLIGIPFALALLFAWVLAYVFGVVAVFQSVGHRVMRMLGRPDASQLGIVLIGCLVLSVLRFFPLVGGLLWFAIGCVGLGAVFATRFGTGQPWLRRGVVSPPPPPPPTGPPPAAGPPPSAAPHGGTGPPHEGPVEGSDDEPGFDEEERG